MVCWRYRKAHFSGSVHEIVESTVNVGKGGQGEVLGCRYLVFGYLGSVLVFGEAVVRLGCSGLLPVCPHLGTYSQRYPPRGTVLPRAQNGGRWVALGAK